MAAYVRTSQRFGYRGVSLLPADALPPGKYPFAQNIRSYQDGTIQPREGVIAVTDAPLAGGAVHSIWRLNDPTTFAPAPARRFLGAGAAVYARAPGVGTYAQIDTGYSGDPLSFVNAAPVGSPQPWTYIADRSRQRKVNTNNTVVPIGIAAPTAAPTVALGQPGVTVINDLAVAAAFTQVGAIAAAPSNVTPINTTIATIVYDSGTTGYASIAAVSMANITIGMRLGIAGAETTLITDVLPPIATTTIAAIIYDAGTTGLCTVQPAASLAVGQLEGPRFDEATRRYHPAHVADRPVAPASGLSRVRQIDFPVNCLITINSGGGTAETVRVISVAVGRDGIQSFRCVTANTHAAGESLTGVACFRAHTTGTRSNGDALFNAAIQQVLTPTTTEDVVGGIQATGLGLNLALVGGRATQPEDELWLLVKIDTLNFVKEVRLYLDVDATTTDFLRNYYMAVWRANDIISAIHAANTAVPAPLQTAREDAVIQHQIDQVVEVPEFLDPAGATAAFLQNREALRAAHRQPPAAQALSATATQLALGNNQWIRLKVKIRDLIHVGTDTTRTLTHVNGVELLVTLSGTTSPVTVQYDSALIQGGYGPDVGDTGMPYVYAYRYRSSTTRVYSNLSPPSRGGMVPRRQRITGTATPSADAQADLIDWFRFGGALTRWTYVMTGAALVDDVLDSAIEGGIAPDESAQPWPTADLPRSGTCNVAGTAIQRVGGDVFNTAWAPGTTITVNGVTTTLYAAPSSSSLLHVAANVGSGTGVAWSIPEPVLLGQNLPVHWGGVVQNVVFRFACGDAMDPGALYWTIGDNPDATRDAYWRAITSASEPLQHGCVYDGVPFVFSTEQLYRIEPTFGDVHVFRATATACGKGLWSRWAFAVAPEGIYFLAKDGLYLTAFGSVAVSITDPDLTEIFPHDDAAGRTVNGIAPPDMTLTTRLRLSIVGRFLYFDYRDVAGQDRTLVYDRLTKAWTPDVYALSGVHCRLSESGAQVVDHLIGAANGHVYQMAQTAVADIATPIAWAVHTPHADAGDPRIEKQFGDVLLDYDLRGATQALSVTPVYNHASASLAPHVVAGGTTGRQQTTWDLQSGAGVLARNLGLQITGSSVSGDPARPLLYLWEPAFLAKVEQAARRASDWDAAGYAGSKFVQGCLIRANTYNVAKAVQVESDGGTVALTLSIQHDGEVTKAYPLAAAGWTPFTAKLLRVRGADAVPWQLLDVQWVFEPAPEAATHWQTQSTTFDLPGFLWIRDAVIAYAATAAVTFSVRYDGGVTLSYTLPATAGVYTRAYQLVGVGKGRSVSFALTSSAPFQLFQKDCTVRVGAWGSRGGYLQTMPFGGPHRAAGAVI